MTEKPINIQREKPNNPMADQLGYPDHAVRTSVVGKGHNVMVFESCGSFIQMDTASAYVDVTDAR